MSELKYKSIIRKLNEYLLYPSRISFYGYGGSTAPVIDDPSARAYRRHIQELKRTDPSFPVDLIYRSGEKLEIRGQETETRITIHEDEQHPWHIDHVMFVPGVKESTFFHERRDSSGNPIENLKKALRRDIKF
jgi:hypothetical protein